MRLRWSLLLIVVMSARVHAGVNYPVVYVAVPRDPEIKGVLQDVSSIVDMEPGSHLRMLSPDGTDRVLWHPGSNGGVMDPTMSLDGKWLYFAASTDVRPVKFQYLPTINLFAINVASKQLRQLTFSTEPGDYNTGPCEVPGGRLIFTSSRNRINPISELKKTSSRYLPVMQLFALRLDSPANTVEQVGFLNL
ncbi:MAG: hypothetical protein KF861_20110, partial [Planctomycetaceae bacterium]|nr:hypothetical protein [Planctomycetaceae bacterium]